MPKPSPISLVPSAIRPPPAFTASRPISSSILPRPQPVTSRMLANRIYLDLLRYELQAMTSFERALIFDRVTSVAAMQEQLRNSLANCRGPDCSLQLSAQESTKPVDLVR